MQKGFKILGVDPGTVSLGYAVLEVSGNTLKVQSIGVIELKKFESHQEKLKEIYLQLQEIIETYLPTQMAIESPFFGKNVQSMLKLGRAQGVSMAAAITMGLEITEYSPKKIKQSITGNGNASKEQVSNMLSSILNINLDNLALDASDALATALTHHHQTKNGVALNSGSKSWKNFIANNPGRVS